MKKELWLRIRNYQFDNLVPPHLADHVVAMFGKHDASTHAFASKLARKRGWSNGFALRAIDEYKKFVYLGVTSDTPVTPSKHVDQVWHQHLLFTKAYREFCTDILRRDFDHHPELVPMDTQTEVFSEQYEDTLRLYVAEFNKLPPKDIWGTPKFPLDARQPRRVKYADATGHTPDNSPLYMSFVGSDGGSSSGGNFSEFGGGGGFSGGGGGDSWGSDSSTGSDSTSSGGDSGGGSGCSSSCGGGGCGGGGGGD
jgi:hypothetical protein